MAKASGLLLLLIVITTAPGATAQPQGRIARKPLYRDPVYDGAADPMVIWNPNVRRWWMFYTNRRASIPGLSGVAWVHGTPVGIAESSDEGATWSYAGNANIDTGTGRTETTFWAPEVIAF